MTSLVMDVTTVCGEVTRRTNKKGLTFKLKPRPMKRLVALMMCAVSLGAAAQSTITYPYNPDGNADALIGVTDLQDMLSTYGGAFLPSEILVGDSTLSFWVDQLSETVLTQQATIDSLVELQPKEYIITVADSLDGDWVTIASVGDDSTTPFKLRADADFEFTHNIGSSHQKIKVRASHLFGNGHTLDLHRISYSDSQAMIVAFRIAHGNTYDGAVLQMKVRQNSWWYNGIKLRVTNNNNDSGWHIHPDILQGQSLSADNSPIGYVVDHPSASDAPYVEFYPSIDGEDCLGYDTTEGDVILNSNLIVKGVNVAEALDNAQEVQEVYFNFDGEYVEIQPTQTIVLYSGQCGTTNSGAGVNCTDLNLILGNDFYEGEFSDFEEVKIFNAGTVFSDDPVFYDQEVRFYLYGQEYGVMPNRYVILVHFQGEWFVEDDGLIGDD